MNEYKKVSYSRLVKSASIIGVSSLFVMLSNMFRTKMIAILIGPYGVGLQSSYISIQNMVSTTTSLGIGSSAVRNIASSVSSGQYEQLGKTVSVLRLLCIFTGVLGLIPLLFFSTYLSDWMFGSDAHSFDIALIGGVIFLTHVASGELAIIQGMRKVKFLAKASITSAIISSSIAIFCYFVYRENGIILALVLSSIIYYLCLKYYSSRIQTNSAPKSLSEWIGISKIIIKLGLAITWGNLLSSMIAFFTVALISRDFSIETVGVYSAGYTLSVVFVNFILQAMGTDFFSHLSGLKGDETKMIELINKQIEIGLLIAFPGVLAVITFASILIKVFYTEAFLDAINLMHWFVLGGLISVAQIPMGHLQLALGRSRVWILTQSIFAAVSVLLIWLGIEYIGLVGVAIAYAVRYAFSFFIINKVAVYLIGFKWTQDSIRVFKIVIPSTACVFILSEIFNKETFFAVGSLFVIIALAFSYRELRGRIKGLSAPILYSE